MKAVIVGVILGGALGALYLQEPSQVPVPLVSFTQIMAVLLVTAALTQRAKMGTLCGALAASSQFLALFGFLAYSYTVGVAMGVAPFESPWVVAYPLAGAIGGYIPRRTA